MIRESYLSQISLMSDRESSLQNSPKKSQNKVKCQLYDVCYHCQRVIESGSFLDHLKSECTPRRKRMLRLQNRNQQQNLSYHPRTQQLIRDPEDIDEQIVPRIQSFRYIEERNVRREEHNHDFRHKIFSPWTLQFPKHIRDHIKPTRQIIIGQK